MKTRIVIAGTLVVLAASLAWAGPFEHGPGGRGGGKGIGRACKWLEEHPKQLEKAGLTEEDLQTLKALSYEQRKEQIQLRANEQLAKLELENLMQQDAPAETAVISALEKVNQAEFAAKKAAVLHQLKVRNTLGAEKADKLRAAMKQVARRRMKQGERDHDGPRQGNHQRGGQRQGGRRGQQQGCGRPDWDEAPPVEETAE